MARVWDALGTTFEGRRRCPTPRGEQPRRGPAVAGAGTTSMRKALPDYDRGRGCIHLDAAGRAHWAAACSMCRATSDQDARDDIGVDVFEVIESGYTALIVAEAVLNSRSDWANATDFGGSLA